ncbi:MAG: hypothetical protein V5A60_14905 [Haloarculaceae archaeon]
MPDRSRRHALRTLAGTCAPAPAGRGGATTGPSEGLPVPRDPMADVGIDRSDGCEHRPGVPLAEEGGPA